MKRARECSGPQEFTNCKEFKTGVLITKRDVLQRLIHEDNWIQAEGANLVGEELFSIWIHNNAYCISTNAISLRIAKLELVFAKLIQLQKKKSKTTFTQNCFWNLRTNCWIFFATIKSKDLSRKKHLICE